MSYSYTVSETQAFTVTHARHIAAKVATDLKRLQRLYGKPDDARIDRFETELIELLKGGYVETVTYGFKRNGDWIVPTLQYTAQDLADTAANDDDPGKIKAGADIVGASFGSYLTYSRAWSRLTKAEQEAFEAGLPIRRTTAPEPGVNGYFVDDRTYSAGGRAMRRASVRGY